MIRRRYLAAGQWWKDKLTRISQRSKRRFNNCKSFDCLRRTSLDHFISAIVHIFIHSWTLGNDHILITPLQLAIYTHSTMYSILLALLYIVNCTQINTMTCIFTFSTHRSNMVLWRSIIGPHNTIESWINYYSILVSTGSSRCKRLRSTLREVEVRSRQNQPY